MMTFGEAASHVYDAELRGDEADTVRFLADLAGDGTALELAIGTGRIARPLRTAGVEVHGIDMSEAMVRRLRSHPDGFDIPVTMGDFAEVDVPGRYRLVYVVYNSFFNLLSQDEQVRCVANVAAHLEEGGVFVIESVFTLGWFLHTIQAGQYVHAEAVGVDTVTLDALQIDAAAQLVRENHVRLSPEGMTFNPVVQRWAMPHEVDLMAKAAGLHLRERWGDWRRQPFGNDSLNSISVYG